MFGVGCYRFVTVAAVYPGAQSWRRCMGNFQNAARAVSNQPPPCLQTCPAGDISRLDRAYLQIARATSHAWNYTRCSQSNLHGVCASTDMSL